MGRDLKVGVYCAQVLFDLYRVRLWNSERTLADRGKAQDLPCFEFLCVVLRVNSESSRGDLRCSGFGTVKKFRVQRLIFVCRFVLVVCNCHVKVIALNFNLYMYFNSNFKVVT